ncbi:MAG: cytochrome P450 [Proteobacteria bacterium]|nr:cytochrome P450 [Pseudomonadota bacterium]
MAHAGGPTLREITVVSPEHYAKAGYPHEIWTRLRAEDPVHYFESCEKPFWAITKHADIIEISRQPERFLNGPLLSIGIDPSDDPQRVFPPTLLNMDPPQHREFRDLVRRRFTRSSLERMRNDIEQIAGEVLDEVSTGDEFAEMDFVDRVSAPVPIAVIAWMLGLPRSDWRKLFRWSNELIGADDPEYQLEGEDRRETARRSQLEVFEYFSKLLEDRRANPQDDLISAFVHGELSDGRKLDLGEVLSYCLIILVAGNETTRNATSGGMLAFIEHPDQWRKLRDDPSLMKPAVEEILRWTSPVIHFARTATEDYELRGRKIREGDLMALFYPSANRDEEIFDDPFEFRIDRNPNRHLAFGVGEHFCLGAHVARTEIDVIFRHMLTRLGEIELLAEPERLRSCLVGGLKHIPVRYRMSAAA